MRTAEQWFAYGDNLPLELGRSLAPRPWKHDIMGVRLNTAGRAWCRKCKQWVQFECFKAVEPCSVPYPIKIDWNTAKYWQGKCILGDFELCAQQVVIADGGSEFSDFTITECLATLGALYDIRYAKLPLIAAAMAAERSKE